MPADPERPVAAAEGPGQRPHQHRVQRKEREAALARWAPVVAALGDVEVPAGVPGGEGLGEALATRTASGRAAAAPAGKSTLARNAVPLVRRCTREHRDERVEGGRAQALRGSSRGARRSRPGRGVAGAAAAARTAAGSRRAAAAEHQQHQERLREAADAHEAEVEAAGDAGTAARRPRRRRSGRRGRQRAAGETARGSRCGRVVGARFAHPRARPAGAAGPLYFRAASAAS